MPLYEKKIENDVFGYKLKLQHNDLKKYDIIDLDAYGCPYDQLCELFNQKYKGLVFFTFIQSGLGTLRQPLLYEVYKDVEMIKKMRTMFITQGFEIFQMWLRIRGVERISYQHLKSTGSNKYYGYFLLK